MFHHQYCVMWRKKISEDSKIIVRSITRGELSFCFPYYCFSILFPSSSSSSSLPVCRTLIKQCQMCAFATTNEMRDDGGGAVSGTASSEQRFDSIRFKFYDQETQRSLRKARISLYPMVASKTMFPKATPSPHQRILPTGRGNASN